MTEIKTPSLSADEIYSLARGQRILDDKWREPTKWEIYLAQQIETVTQERDELQKFQDDIVRITAMWLDTEECNDASLTPTQRILNSVKYMQAEFESLWNKLNEAYELSAQIADDNDIRDPGKAIRALKTEA